MAFAPFPRSFKLGPSSKKLINSQQILYFADDVLIRIKTKKHAEEAIKAKDELEEFDLIINKKKSQVIRDPICLKDLEEI